MRVKGRGRAVVWVAVLVAAVGALSLGAIASGQQRTGKGLAHEGRTYVYLKTRGTHTVSPVYNGKFWSVYVPQTTEQWIAKDGSGRQREVADVPGFVSGDDRRSWEEAGRPRFLAHGFRAHTGTQVFPAGGFPDGLYWNGLLSNMPEDPRSASGWLREQANAPSNGGGNGFPEAVRALDLLQYLLPNPLATSEQRAAVVSAATEIPGIQELGEARDEVGRRGVLVAAESANSGALTRYSMLVDPETSRLLSYETLRLEPLPAQPDQAVPVLEGRTVYLGSGLVHSMRARPGRDQTG